MSAEAKEIPGAGHMQEIARLVRIYRKAVETSRYTLTDNILERCHEMPLTVQVRSGWYSPGGESEAVEYEILLGTGGPAVRIIGDLDAHGHPHDAELQGQDWFTPWERTPGQDQDALLTFASMFYFGE
jgi:hypothetical protein|tara:strand:- start:1946 stop:2329 length:384 start_codon:yes stop_codon:yes gene_type:complete